MPSEKPSRTSEDANIAMFEENANAINDMDKPTLQASNRRKTDTLTMNDDTGKVNAWIGEEQR